MAPGNDDNTTDNDPTIARPRPHLVRSIANEVTVPVSKEELESIKPPASRWRRMAPILAVLVVVLAAGPFISRFIDTYRAVVIDVQSGKMMIQEPSRPPRWVPAIDVKPGGVIAKDAFTWNPHTVEPETRDAPGIELAERWQSSYEGTIVEMRPPVAQGRGATAVVDTTDGRRIEVTLFAEHLATASVGRVLHKDAHTWDPVMLSPRREPSGSFSLTPQLPNPPKQPPTPTQNGTAPHQPAEH